MSRSSRCDVSTPMKNPMYRSKRSWSAAFLRSRAVSRSSISLIPFLRRFVGTDDERTAARFGQEPAATFSSTPEPRPVRGLPASRPSSSLARGWRLVWPWITDTIGAISIFVILIGGLFFLEVLRP